MKDYEISPFQVNTTKVLSCRKGDIMLWVHDISNMWSFNGKFEVADLWNLNDGDSIILTNRLEDVPEWLPIPPNWVGGRNVRQMVHRLNNGDRTDDAGSDLNSLADLFWKVNLSHYVVWSGEKRSDITDCNGILGIFIFEKGSLMVKQEKEPCNTIFENSLSCMENKYSKEKVIEIKGALNFIQSRGKPRKYAEEWRLG